MRRIKGYYAHVYFEADTLDQARALCEEATQLFLLKMGRVHQRPVGPHPDWSCQLAFDPQYIGVVLPWLALNRKGLVIFLHRRPATTWSIKPTCDLDGRGAAVESFSLLIYRWSADRLWVHLVLQKNPIAAAKGC